MEKKRSSIFWQLVMGLGAVAVFWSFTRPGLLLEGTNAETVSLVNALISSAAGQYVLMCSLIGAILVAESVTTKDLGVSIFGAILLLPYFFLTAGGFSDSKYAANISGTGAAFYIYLIGTIFIIAGILIEYKQTKET